MASLVCDFDSAFQQVAPLTEMSADRLRVLWDCATACVSVAGDVAELGVYRGGSSMLLALACPGKTVFAIDTFTGLPNIGEYDAKRKQSEWFGHQNGDFAVTDVDQVLQRLYTLGIVVRVGVFPAIASGMEDRKFSLCHCDADTFESTWSFLQFFYPRMTPAGAMIFDDYEWSATPGVKKAVDEFLLDKPEVPEVRTPFQCVVVKRAAGNP